MWNSITKIHDHVFTTKVEEIEWIVMLSLHKKPITISFSLLPNRLSDSEIVTNFIYIKKTCFLCQLWRKRECVEICMCVCVLSSSQIISPLHIYPGYFTGKTSFFCAWKKQTISSLENHHNSQSVKNYFFYNKKTRTWFHTQEFIEEDTIKVQWPIYQRTFSK